MKKIFILLVISTILIACYNNNNCFIVISPELDSILDEYIDKNPDNKIYYLTFENRCNKQFFTLQCSSDCYDSNFVDGCFMKKGKIIVFWSVNKSWKDSLLHIPQEELCFDSLAKYTDFAKTEMDYDAPYNALTYRIISVNEYRKATDSDWSYPESARDSNVICSSVLNDILNNYINTNNSPIITYLRFSNLNGTDFVSIGQDYVYDPEAFSGMFYRNERIVVVYSIDKLRNLDIIDKLSLLPIHTICDYKSHKRKYPIGEKKYCIVSKNTIEPISSDNKLWMDI
jgi:hypothetical protein